MTADLDDAFSALSDMGLTTDAFTVGTAAYVARQAAVASVRNALAQDWLDASTAVGAASFASTSGLLAAVDAAGRLAQATAALADLAAA